MKAEAYGQLLSCKNAYKMKETHLVLALKTSVTKKKFFLTSKFTQTIDCFCFIKAATTQSLNNVQLHRKVISSSPVPAETARRQVISLHQFIYYKTKTKMSGDHTVMHCFGWISCSDNAWLWQQQWFNLWQHMVIIMRITCKSWVSLCFQNSLNSFIFNIVYQVETIIEQEYGSFPTWTPPKKLKF